MAPDTHPTELGPYRLVRRISSGGMGTVYEAQHAQTGARCALKTLLAGGADAPIGLERFRREAQSMAQIEHPNVAQVHAAELDGATPYLVMELLGGGTLDERIRSGPLSPEDAVEVSVKLAGAIQAAHDRGVLHRDLKPQNVLFDDRGEPKVTDFGVALVRGASRLSKTGDVFGTPSYMAPEQARDAKTTDERTDVYALGAMLYAMLVGRPPFDGASVLVVLDAVISASATAPRALRPEVPAAVSELCMRALAKAPGERPQTASAFAAELQEAADRGAQSLPWPLIGLALGLLVLAGVALAFGARTGAPAPAETPQQNTRVAETALSDLSRLLASRSVAGTDRVARALAESAISNEVRAQRIRSAYASALDPKDATRSRASRVERIGEVARAILPAPDARRAKEEAWAECHDAWARELEGKAQAQASGVVEAFRHLRDALRVDPTLDAVSLARVTSRAFTALLERDEVELAVALQVERNSLDLVAPLALQEAVSQGPLGISSLKVGAPITREFSNKWVRSTILRPGSGANAGGQLDAYLTLAHALPRNLRDLNAEGVERCAELARAVLTARPANLGLRQKLETRLILQTFAAGLLRRGDSREAKQLLAEIEATRQDLLALGHVDHLLLTTIDLERRVARRWRARNTVARRLRESLHAIRPQLDTPAPRFRAGDTRRQVYGEILLELASDCTEHGAIEEADQALNEAKGHVDKIAVDFQASNPGVHPSVAQKQAREFELGVILGRIRWLSAQGRDDEAIALEAAHASSNATNLNTDFGLFGVEFHRQAGRLDEARERLGWVRDAGDYAARLADDLLEAYPELR